MDITELEKNVTTARTLIYTRRELLEFIKSLDSTDEFSIGAPGGGLSIYGPRVWLKKSEHPQIIAAALDSAKSQIAEIERRLVAMGVDEWGIEK